MTAGRADTAHARSTAARWVAVTFVLGFVGLGAAWAVDRARTWERPRWEASRFVALRGGHVPPPGSHGLVAVAVNTRCPHCLESLAALADSLEPLRAAGRAPRLVALVVDAPVRPGAREIARVNAGLVAWDSAQVWRHRWGRRLYGDVLHFDAGGRWTTGADPPARASHAGGPGTPDRPRSPEGGEDS